MRYPVVLDLETKYTFRTTSDHKKLGISVVGLYDYADSQMKCFCESELGDLYKILENSSLIIGYNINSFDLPVLQGYYYGDVTQFKTFDLLDDIRMKLGRRLALNDLIKATLNKGKSGHGLQAIELFKQNKMEELKQYCKDDVLLTKELFDYGCKNREIYYLTEKGKTTIQVSWEKYSKPTENIDEDISLTLPF
ncbi:MAG TPA: ribonuclease H-like domain-containing protein [Candidatus Nitrosocosmicus sp.]|nr:ribonuclease H-like domain-containing protein [Candidatus Nitrosocosmicus sp.]